MENQPMTRTGDNGSTLLSVLKIMRSKKCLKYFGANRRTLSFSWKRAWQVQKQIDDNQIVCHINCNLLKRT